MPLHGEKITLDDLRRMEDAGATGIVSLPFAFTLGPKTSLAEKCAHLESHAENAMAKLASRLAT